MQVTSDGSGQHQGVDTMAGAASGAAPSGTAAAPGPYRSGASAKAKEGPAGPSCTSANTPRRHQRCRNVESAACWAESKAEPEGCGRQPASPKFAQSTRRHAWTWTQAAAATSEAPN